MVSTRSSSAALMTPRTGRSSSPPAPPSALSKTLAKTRAATRGGAPSSPPTSGWAHAPTRLSLIWLAISVPLVIWDMGYVFLRPYSMPGGALHWPVWAPYAIQAELDYTYGTKAWVARDGWNAAQSAVNLAETVAYIVYLVMWYRNAGKYGRKEITGRTGAVAALVGFSAALTTLSKTVLYWLNEAFSDFANIGHNPPARLFFLWIIPNGAWIVFPAIMVYTMSADILDGLTLASRSAGAGRASKSE